MRLARNFTELPGADAMASLVLALAKEGNTGRAFELACEAADNAWGASFFELNALAVAMAARAGQTSIALEYWDRIIRSAPHKLRWLEAGVRHAWSVNTAETAGYLKKWLGFLDNVFISVPSFQFLEELEKRGLAGTGSIGIHDGRLRGWLWLDPDERPIISADLPKKENFALALHPVARGRKVLYSIDQPLPQYRSIFRISLGLGNGVPIQGSPVICASSACANTNRATCAVAVLIPVYGDRVATLRCIGNLLASLRKNRIRPEIYIAWDKGPDALLLSRLQRLEERKKIRLIVNPCNMGFLAGVNHALSRIGPAEVILLNSDTIVHANWLDRLLAAGRREDAATVTALGNEAELMSYPSSANRGRVSSLSQVKLLDQAAARIPENEALLEIPVGVGFCMLITSRALKRLGALDGACLFRGYGEEVEYCLRASKAGLKNYGAFNIFVGHLGERSFGAAKKALASQNNEAIFAHFPAYRKDYERFVAHPAPALLRARLSRNLLAGLPPISTLELRPYSMRGLPPWIRDEKCGSCRKGAVLFAKPGPAPVATLRVWSDLPVGETTFDLRTDLALLKGCLADLGCRAFLPVCCSDAVLALAGQLGLRREQRPKPEKLPVWERSGTDAVLVSPPARPAGWRRLVALARANPDISFYVYSLDSLWQGVPVPENMLPLALASACLAASDFILADSAEDVDDWRLWLDAHIGRNMQIYGLP